MNSHETLGGSRLEYVEESVARGIDRGTDTVGNSYEDLNGVNSLILRKDRVNYEKAKVCLGDPPSASALAGGAQKVHSELLSGWKSRLGRPAAVPSGIFSPDKKSRSKIKF